MSRKFLTPIDLNANELQNAVVGNLTSDPTGAKGRIYFNSSANTLKVYNGTDWQTLSTGAGSFTLGSTSVSLGSTVTTIAGMSSITSTTFVGALSGNASTATALQTSRTINGTSFDGSANITITAVNPNALTIGTGLSGSSYTGASSVTIALATTGTAGTYTKVTTDAYGRVTSGTTLSSGDIPDISGTYLTTSAASSTYLTQSNAASTYAPKANPTFTGSVTVPAPTAGTDAANKQYVDGAVAGLSWKEAVNLLATSNVALTGNTETLVIDGHAALDGTDDGYRILLTAQTTAADKGIYVYTDDGTTYTLARATDADTYQELIDATVLVLEGTTYGKTSWVQGNHYLSSFSGQNWVQFTGASSVTPGDGLTQDGSELNVVGTADRISVSADAVNIASTYVGQTSITTLGTITTGVWNGTDVAVAAGGTGASTAAGARSNLGAAGKSAGDIGAAASTGTFSFAYTHSLNTTDVVVSVKEVSTKAMVEVDVVVTDANTVTVSWNAASTFSSGAYRITVIG
jgi:hypothetical protein